MGFSMLILDAAIAEVLGESADRDLIDRLRPLLLQSIGASADDVAALLDTQATVGVGHPAVEAYLAEHIPKLSRVNLFTKLRVRNLIAKSIEQGKSVTQQTTLLRRQFRQFRGSRARTIARTENGIAWHMSSHNQRIDLGIAAGVWLTSRDARVRRSHLIDGQCRETGVPFDLRSGVLLLHPHDPSGPPAEIINCRCVTTPLPKGCAAAPRGFSDETFRAALWRLIIRQIESHERRVQAEMRRIFAAQGRALVESVLAKAA